MEKITDNIFSMKGEGWGYWKIDPNYSGNYFWSQSKHYKVDQIEDFNSYYFLNGCDPDKMFKPGTEPENFKWFWQDNSMMPWLRYPSPSNPVAHKLWTRLTYCSWCMTENSPIDVSHRERVNKRLSFDSGGVIQDISDLWGGVKETILPTKKKALVVPSSLKNHRNYYNETPEKWVDKIIKELKRQDYNFVVRQKELDPSRRINNQVVDQFLKEECDLLIGNHTAATSEVVVLGYPVVTTSGYNPAREISTTWSEFCSGNIRHFTKKQIDDWVTRICSYTYYRDEINSQSWIDVHPDANQIRKMK